MNNDATRSVSPQPLARQRQAGVMLLEALLALLIFSVGILAIVGMQASAIQDMGEAKYRSDAAFLANQVIADMWSNPAKLDAYKYSGKGNAPAILDSWVRSVNAKLPGSTTFPPIVDVTGNAVTITVRWQQARDSEKGIDAGARRYTTVAYISCC